MRAVDHREAYESADAARLAARLGRWTDGGGTLAERLAAAVTQLVEGGELRRGDLLPPERALATAVAVSRGTVVAAYAQLAEAGAVERRQGSGTRVAARSGAGGAVASRGKSTAGRGAALFSALPSGIDLLRAVPIMPALAVEIVRDHRLTVDPRTLSETDAAGIPALRARIAALLTDDGTPTTPAQVLVTHGAQQGLSLVIDELVGPGDVVLTEAVTWPGLTDSVQRRGGRVHGVSMGADGIDLDELEAAVASLRPALIAVHPHHHNPTGTRLSQAGRERLARLSAEYGVPVLEDRVLAHISFDGVVPPTLAALRPDAPIIVVDSLSKWSWPGLRVGWVRADPVLGRRLRSIRQLVDSSTSVPAQLIALDLLDRARELRRDASRTHAAAAERLLAAVAQHLPDWEVTPPRGGLSLWAGLPSGSATAFARAAAMRGVAVAGGTEFTASEVFDDHLRLPFTAPDDVLQAGVAVLGEVWRDFRSRG